MVISNASSQVWPMPGTSDVTVLTPDLVAAFASLFIHNPHHYAVQQWNGSYWRVCEPLTLEMVAAHLEGRITLGTYLLDAEDCCSFAIFDADSNDGLEKLALLQQQLAGDGVPSLLEASRRGGHLWVHFAQPAQASQVRAWLLPYAFTYGIEFYPKQNALGLGGSGSVIRVPLGVHRKSRGWYPFLAVTDNGLLVPVGNTVAACCAWAVEAVQRVALPDGCRGDVGEVGMGVGEHDQDGGGYVAREWPGRDLLMPDEYESIRTWCAAQDCRAVIGRYVALDRRGVGSCPFKEHHYRGDRRPSFQAFSDHWYCYTWGRAGDLCDFLGLYHNLSAQEVWQRVRAGWQP